MDYRQKYLKYKAKYVALKNMMGGELKDTLERINAEIKIDIKGDIYITCDLDVKEVINKKQQNITKKQTFKIFNLNQLKKEGTKFLCTDKSNNKIEIFKYFNNDLVKIELTETYIIKNIIKKSNINLDAYSLGSYGVDANYVYNLFKKISYKIPSDKSILNNNIINNPTQDIILNIQNY